MLTTEVVWATPGGDPAFSEGQVSRTVQPDKPLHLTGTLSKAGLICPEFSPNGIHWFQGKPIIPFLTNQANPYGVDEIIQPAPFVRIRALGAGIDSAFLSLTW